MGFPALVIGHVVICLPFTVRTIAISLAAMPANVEQAADSLGATPIGRAAPRTLPLAIRRHVCRHDLRLHPQSFDDVNLSLFLARPGASTITVTILGFLEFGFAPTLAAVSIVHADSRWPWSRCSAACVGNR